MKKVLVSTGFKEYGYTHLAEALSKIIGLEVVLFSGLVLTKGMHKSRAFNLIRELPIIKSMNFRSIEKKKVKVNSNSLIEIINWFAIKYNIRLLDDLTRKSYRKKLSRFLKKDSYDILILRPGFFPDKILPQKTYTLLSIAHPDFIIIELEKQNIDTSPFKTSLWLDTIDDLRKTKNIIVNSNFISQTFPKDLIEKRFFEIYNPIDYSSSNLDSIKRTPRSFCFVGEVGHRKGFDRIIRVFDQFHLKNINLTIVGNLSVELKYEFFQFIKNHERNNKIVYIPSASKNELSKIYSSNEFFIFPTRAEGSSRAVIEAMIEGCIPLTSVNCGVEVLNGLNAVVVEDWENNFIYNCLNATCYDFSLIRKNAMSIKKLYSKENYHLQIRNLAASFDETT